MKYNVYLAVSSSGSLVISATRIDNAKLLAERDPRINAESLSIKMINGFKTDRLGIIGEMRL